MSAMRTLPALVAALCVLAAADTARAQFAMGANNNNQPINISSDTLEVQQDKQLAIFRGKVDVVQGDSRLRSDELFVHYRERGAQPPAGQPARATPPKPAGPTIGPGGPDASSITKIEAKGNVFISTPKERAQGTLGIYDVDRKTITLTGNVLLTSDQNTVRCERVVMYQDSGRTTCDPASQGRVQAIIVPNNAEQQPAQTQGQGPRR